MAHSSIQVLGEVSDRLYQQGVPHVAVLGDLRRPRELLRAAYRAGVQDVHDFLFVQSLVSLGRCCGGISAGLRLARPPPAMLGLTGCRRPSPPRCVQLGVCTQGGASALACFEELAADHGVVALDEFGGPAAQTHGAAASPHLGTLRHALSAVFEGDEDAASAAETPTAQLLALPEADTPAAVDGSTSASCADGGALLAAAAAAGLLPRPGVGSHFLTASGVATSLLHLDPVPFVVRCARAEDAPAVHRLQSFARPALAPRRLGLARVRRLLQRPERCWQWVAEVEGAVVAALVLAPEGRPAPGGGAALGVALAAVHPSLEEGAELFCALAHFALQRLLSEPAVEELRQGRLLLKGGGGGGEEGAGAAQPGDGDGAGAGGLLARFFTAPGGSGARQPSETHLERVCEEEGEGDAQVSEHGGGSRGVLHAAAGAAGGLAQRAVAYEPGCSFDSFVAAVVEGVGAVALPLSTPRAASTPAPAGGDSGSAALRAKLSSIVDEVRRMTQTLGTMGDGEPHSHLKS